jgi:hypothetical protein
MKAMRTGPALFGGMALLLALTLGASGSPAAAAGGSPPPATFTPNARADFGLGSDGQGDNEPQVTVDQSGTAYVTWQGGANGPMVAKTADGSTFSKPISPDPNKTFADVELATTNWRTPGLDVSPGLTGTNGVFWGNIGATACGPLEIREATSLDQGGSWAPTDAACDPNQVDRPWVAAYTPSKFRNTSSAVANTEVFFVRHDFTTSDISVTRSFDGGTTWNEFPQLAEQPGSYQQLDTTCNSIPSGIAFDQRGAHPGRVYVIWETSDLLNNLGLGCDYTQAQTFDRIFMSYSDDGGNTWVSQTVFSDPGCPASASPQSSFPNACQDVSELFNGLAVDDAGNVYVAFAWRDPTLNKPEYDIYVEQGGPQSNGGIIFGNRHRVNTDTGTHYMPWVAAGQSGAIDVVYYDTSFVEGVGAFNKPAAAPGGAQWNVEMAQSFNGGQSFTQSQVSDHPVYFGDICTVGIFCGPQSGPLGWGQDRILFDDFGVAIGPDGAARIAWTDSRNSWTSTCNPQVSPNDDKDVSCQTTFLYFACQSGGVGLYGQIIKGCPVAVKP